MPTDRLTSPPDCSVSTDAPLRLLRAAEAARVLAISPRKLWSLTASGDIPHVRIGRVVRYSRLDLEAWIKSHTKRGKHA